MKEKKVSEFNKEDKAEMVMNLDTVIDELQSLKKIIQTEDYQEFGGKEDVISFFCGELGDVLTEVGRMINNEIPPHQVLI